MPRRDSPLERNPSLGQLPRELSENLREVNPWWTGRPGPALPSFRRWPFDRLHRLVRTGMTPVVVLRGPRRVGKTVLLRQIIESLLGEGAQPNRILYVPFDELPTFRSIQEPVLAIARWFEREILFESFNETGRRGEPALLFFDEVQNLDAWAPQIKNLVDNHTVRALVTGSSSLRIEAGRDSLAGRITTFNMGPLLLREIAQLRFKAVESPSWVDNGLDAIARPDFWHDAISVAQRVSSIRHQAFRAFSERGAYPVAQERPETPWYELADYLNESVIKRAIQHDLRLGPRGQKRDERLLEEVFRLACRYAGQAAGQKVFVPKIQQALENDIEMAIMDGARGVAGLCINWSVQSALLIVGGLLMVCDDYVVHFGCDRHEYAHRLVVKSWLKQQRIQMANSNSGSMVCHPKRTHSRERWPEKWVSPLPGSRWIWIAHKAASRSSCLPKS